LASSSPYIFIFWQFWGLNFTLARQVLYHLSCLQPCFPLVIFEVRSHFCAQSDLDHNLTILSFPQSLRQACDHHAQFFFLLRWGLQHFLPRLAWNHNLLNHLSLPCSCNDRCAPRYPVIG
jgi:hypothetical protein